METVKNTSEEDRAISRTLPNSVGQTFTVAKYELLNHLSSRRFYVLLAIIGLIAAGLTAAAAFKGASLFGTSALTFFSGWYTGGVIPTYITVFCVVFFGGDAISGEGQNKSGLFLIGNPVNRSTIYIGKFLSALIASVAIISIFTAITLANGIYYFGSSVPYQFVEAYLFTMMFLISALSLTLFFSSLFKSSTISIVVSSILLVVGFFILMSTLGTRLHLEPWYVLTYGSDIIGNILNPSGYPLHIVTSSSGSIVSFNATIPEGLVIMAVYAAITFFAGLFLFLRKEIS